MDLELQSIQFSMPSKPSVYQSVYETIHQVLSSLPSLHFPPSTLRLLSNPPQSSRPFPTPTPPPVRYTAILIEIGNIVLDCSLKNLTAIPVFTFKSIICCSATSLYQRGELTRPEYFERLQREFQLSVSEVEETFAQVESTYTVNTALLSFLKKLKAACGDLQIYAVANVGKEDYASIFNLPVEWDVFDRIFTSSQMALRKPDLRCFNHVLGAIGKLAEELIFIDWDTDNVMTALSLGMKGIVYKGPTEIRLNLLNLLRDPTARAKAFLRRGAKTFDSISSNGVIIHENFAQLLILEATGDPYVSTFAP